MLPSMNRLLAGCCSCFGACVTTGVGGGDGDGLRCISVGGCEGKGVGIEGVFCCIEPSDGDGDVCCWLSVEDDGECCGAACFCGDESVTGGGAGLGDGEAVGVVVGVDDGCCCRWSCCA